MLARSPFRMAGRGTDGRRNWEQTTPPGACGAINSRDSRDGDEARDAAGGHGGPALGEHSEAILAELGYSEAEIAALQAKELAA